MLLSRWSFRRGTGKNFLQQAGGSRMGDQPVIAIVSRSKTEDYLNRHLERTGRFHTNQQPYRQLSGSQVEVLERRSRPTADGVVTFSRVFDGVAQKTVTVPDEILEYIISAGHKEGPAQKDGAALQFS